MDGPFAPKFNPALLGGVVATAQNGIAQNPDNPSMPVVLLTISRPGYATESGNSETMHLKPKRFEYISSISAMDYMEIVLDDPSYEVIDHPLLEEDLRTDLEVRFGYLDGANMSDTIKMVFYRQKPTFPQQGMVETMLTAFDQMIFFTLPLDTGLVESGDGVSVSDLVNTIVNEVNNAYGRQIQVQYEGAQFSKKWWRFHTKAKPIVKAGGEVNADNSVQGTIDGTKRDRSARVGTPLEFLYGVLKLAQEENTTNPIELFVEGDGLFFRPTQRFKQPIAKYRYFAQPTPILNQLLSFEPEVQLKPTFKRLRDAHPETGAVDEAESGNVSSEQKQNMTPKSAKVYTTNTDVGGTRVVEDQRGGSPGDLKTSAPEPVVVVKEEVVKQGDTIATIAQRVGVSVNALLIQNNLPLDPSKVQLVPGQKLKYSKETLTADGSLPNGAPTKQDGVKTPEQQVRATRTYLTEEFKAVKAKATVMGDPRLKAGWPIYIDNVGKRFEGPWYIEEARHIIENGYTCELTLSRDGFYIAREQADNTGYDPSGTDYTDVKPLDKQEQDKRIYQTNSQVGGTQKVVVSPSP